jgi:hypothetical protein
MHLILMNAWIEAFHVGARKIVLAPQANEAPFRVIDATFSQASNDVTPKWETPLSNKSIYAKGVG